MTAEPNVPCWDEGLLHPQGLGLDLSLVLSLGLGQGLGLGLVTVLDAPPLSYYPCWLLASPFSLLVHRTPQKSAVYFPSFGAKKANHVVSCTCCI